MVYVKALIIGNISQSWQCSGECARIAKRQMVYFSKSN